MKYHSRETAFYREFEYAPSVRNLHNDENYELLPYARQCFCRSQARIYAKPLEKATKIFTKWDYEKYMMGCVGDYICYMQEDENDIYIIKQEVFDETYTPVS